MKYIYNGEVVSEKEFYNNLDACVDNYANESYDDDLDECYDVVKIGYCKFYASEILKNCDPVAYRCGLSDYANSLLEDAKYELDANNYVEVDGDEFEIMEDEE